GVLGECVIDHKSLGEQVMHVGVWLAVGVLAATSGFEPTAVAQSVGETTVLGPFTGHYAKLHPANEKPYRIAYYGTDLGFSYEHEGQIHFLFGDTSANERGDPIQASTGGAFDDS